MSDEMASQAAQTCGRPSGWHDDGDPMVCERPEGHYPPCWSADIGAFEPPQTGAYAHTCQEDSGKLCAACETERGNLRPGDAPSEDDARRAELEARCEELERRVIAAAVDISRLDDDLTTEQHVEGLRNAAHAHGSSIMAEFLLASADRIERTDRRLAEADSLVRILRDEIAGGWTDNGLVRVADAFLANGAS